MPTWDRRTPDQQAKVRDAALRRQLRDAVAPFSPFWRDRFTALRVPSASIKSVADLTRLPAVTERDVCPSGDPRDAAKLVLQADEAGYALHAYGPELRKAMVRRLGGAAAYRRQVEAEVRPTTFHFAGRSLRYPVASTRNDLDLVARAGARAWSVLGLTNADVLVSAVPVEASLDHLFLTYAAIGAGSPAIFPGPDGLVEAVALVPPTVVAVRPADVGVLDGVDLVGVRTVLLVGVPDAEASAVVAELVPDAAVLGLWGPPEGRVLWAQCAESVATGSTGWHTYPDLDYVELVDPETGQPASAGGEVTVTQLGFRGTALLRWRTGDLVDAPVESGACPACGRTVPRVPAQVRSGATTVSVRLGPGDAEQVFDVRSVTAVLAGRPDIADWQVEVVPSPRGAHDNLFVLIAPTGDETEAAVGVYRDVRAVAGVTPSQVVVLTPEELADRRSGDERVVVRR